MNSLEIIGKIYTLLSECSSRELAEAASIASPSHLGNALRELRDAKLAIEAKQREKTPTSRPVEASQKTATRNGFEARVERIILDHDVFKNNADVAAFLTSLGVDDNFRADKDGRKAMLNKLFEAVKSLDDNSKKKVLSKIYGLLPKSETTGWFEAIRGEVG